MSADDGPASSFVAFDLETTGLFAQNDRIVEIGAVRFDGSGRVQDRFISLIDPQRPMSPAAQAIHGITDADLRDAPTASEVLPQFLDWLGPAASTRLLAHNAVFDSSFLGSELARAGRPLPSHEIIDTLALARVIWPEAPGHRLATLAAFLGLDLSEAHRALADSLRVRGLWLAARERRAHPPLVCYRIFDPRTVEPVPVGWEPLAEAIARGWRVRITYSGGTRGIQPREISPHRFVHKGGVPYVIAHCHVDHFEKSFRLDRIQHFEIVAAS